MTNILHFILDRKSLDKVKIHYTSLVTSSPKSWYQKRLYPLQSESKTAKSFGWYQMQLSDFKIAAADVEATKLLC